MHVQQSGGDIQPGAFDLSLNKWTLPMVDVIHDVELRERLYREEPNLWGYFVSGAPISLTSNIASTRKLINGSPDPGLPSLHVQLPQDVLRMIWQRKWRVEAAARIQRAVRLAIQRSWGLLDLVWPHAASCHKPRHGWLGCRFDFPVTEVIEAQSRGALHHHVVYAVGGRGGAPLVVVSRPASREEVVVYMDMMSYEDVD